MPKKDETPRKRIVVEEIKGSEAPDETIEAKVEAEIKPKPSVMEESPEKTEEIPESKAIKHEETSEKKEEKKPELHPEKTKDKRSLWYVFWIMIPVAFIVGVLAGGVFYYLNSVNKTSPTPTSTPSQATTTPTPSASPSAQVDLTKYQIKVLNGSGIAGEASKAQTILTNAGFKISVTGNAATYDYTDTIIQAGANVESAFISQVKITLSKTYSVADKIQPIPAGETSDVIVIVGSSKATQ